MNKYRTNIICMSIKIACLCLLLVLSSVRLLAQSLDRQVAAAAGSTALAAGIQIDYTIGEPVIAPLTGSGLLLTEGFQQPFTFVLPANAVIPFFAMYPNPTPANTILHFALPAAGNLLVVVYNAIGQRVMMNSLHFPAGETQYILKTALLIPGTYFVKIVLDGYGTSTKKLIKVSP
jgi:hypothetical protein